MSEEPHTEHSEEEPEALAELVYGRIAEDERLRGSLSDAGFGPLLDWCANRIVNVVLEIEHPSLDDLSDAFRDTMQRLVAAAASGDPSSIEGLPSLVIDPGCADELAEAATARADPDQRAEAMAACLVEMSP